MNSLNLLLAGLILVGVVMIVLKFTLKENFSEDSEAILTDSMFNAPDQKIKELVIDLSYAEKQFSKSKISKLKVA